MPNSVSVNFTSSFLSTSRKPDGKPRHAKRPIETVAISFLLQPDGNFFRGSPLGRSRMAAIPGTELRRGVGVGQTAD